MLVISRKIGEEILLPDCDVRISVIDVSGSRIRLGIEAPSNRRVYRKEVWLRICQEAERPTEEHVEV
jgi:carbon storage regulator